MSGTLSRGTHPRAIFIATPPMFRGGLSQSNNLELQLTALFPEANIFLEKPVATGAPWEQSVGEAKEVGGRLEAGHKGVISVGCVELCDVPADAQIRAEVLESGTGDEADHTGQQPHRVRQVHIERTD